MKKSNSGQASPMEWSGHAIKRKEKAHKALNSRSGGTKTGGNSDIVCRHPLYHQEIVKIDTKIQSRMFTQKLCPT